MVYFSGENERKVLKKHSFRCFTNEIRVSLSVLLVRAAVGVYVDVWGGHLFLFGYVIVFLPANLSIKMVFRV